MSKQQQKTGGGKCRRRADRPSTKTWRAGYYPWVLAANKLRRIVRHMKKHPNDKQGLVALKLRQG